MTKTATLPILLDWLRRFGTTVVANKAYLTELDSAIGDADHGINMARGMTAVMEQLDDTAAIDAMFKKVGMALVSTVGGASGPLYGTFFMKFGAAAGSGDELSAAELGAALRAGLTGVQSRGKAELDDKTMVDAMAPALEAWDAAVAADKDIAEVAAAAAAAAAQGRDHTVGLVARKGRASYLGERSQGHQDPGATSTAYLFETLAAALQ